MSAPLPRLISGIPHTMVVDHAASALDPIPAIRRVRAAAKRRSGRTTALARLWTWLVAPIDHSPPPNGAVLRCKDGRPAAG